MPLYFDITQTCEIGILKGIETGTILVIVDIENDIQVFDEHLKPATMNFLHVSGKNTLF